MCRSGSLFESKAGCLCAYFAISKQASRSGCTHPKVPFWWMFFLGIFYLWVKKNRALQNRVKLVKVRCFSVRSNLPNIWCGDFGKIDPFSYRKKNPLRVSTNIAGRNIQHFDGIYQGQNFRCWEFKGKEWHSPLHL